jgi:phosphoglycolate phosphatase
MIDILRDLTPFPRAVVFDLDGTLVDSAPDIARALNAGFAPLGVPPFPAASVHGMIGGGAAVAVRRAAAAAAITLDETEEALVVARFFKTYAAASAEGNGLYPGASETLARLKAAGIGLALCTNKAERITRIALGALGIAHHFDMVVAARDDRPKKPDPAMVLAALGPLGVEPSHAVMVGDSAADVGAARAAGCRCVVVSYGYAPVPAAELGADRVIDALVELPAALIALAVAR